MDAAFDVDAAVVALTPEPEPVAVTLDETDSPEMVFAMETEVSVPAAERLFETAVPIVVETAATDEELADSVLLVAAALPDADDAEVAKEDLVSDGELYGDRDNLDEKVPVLVAAFELWTGPAVLLTFFVGHVLKVE